MISDYYILTPVNFFLENWLYLQSIHRKGHKFAYETDKYWASSMCHSLYLPFLLSLALYILPVYLCFIWTWPVSLSLPLTFPIPLHTHSKFQFLLLSLCALHHSICFLIIILSAFSSFDYLDQVFVTKLINSITHFCFFLFALPATFLFPLTAYLD
jgi:hypothetical protein